MTPLEQEARRLITERCLIAADIDKTLIDRNGRDDEDRKAFLESIAPELIRAARQGTNLAFVSGNSMHEVTSRFLYWLTEHLYLINDYSIFHRFHFFSNSGGIYFHIPDDDDDYTNLSYLASERRLTQSEFFDGLTWYDDTAKKIAINPKYIDVEYVRRTAIEPAHINSIVDIVQEAARKAQQNILTNSEKYRELYHIVDQLPPRVAAETQPQLQYSLFDADNNPVFPTVDKRLVRYGSENVDKDVTVQITVKPVLSFRYGKEPEALFNNDVRSALIQTIQYKLDAHGFDQYVARAGGRSSIDITLEKVDKAYALEFLIDRLNLRPSERKGLRLGSNSIYLGDEVIVGGGNDYPVTRIPGLLVFAVNPDRPLIPSLSTVFVPSTILQGTEAVAEVLSLFNITARHMIAEYVNGSSDNRRLDGNRSAVEAFEEKIFLSGIRDRINDLQLARDISIEDLQVLHTLVSLMCSDDPMARRWLTILVGELDEIMSHLSSLDSVGPVRVTPEAYGSWK